MKLVDFFVGLLTGIVSGFGIGGGSLLILYLTAVAGVDQYTAGGVNLLYFIGCAPTALVSHIRNRRILWRAVWLCALTGVIASVAAAFIGAHMDVGLLRRLFGLLLLYIGFKELFAKAPPKEDPKPDS